MIIFFKAGIKILTGFSFFVVLKCLSYFLLQSLSVHAEMKVGHHKSTVSDVSTAFLVPESGSWTCKAPLKALWALCDHNRGRNKKLPRGNVPWVRNTATSVHSTGFYCSYLTEMSQEWNGSHGKGRLLVGGECVCWGMGERVYRKLNVLYPDLL